jgi:putative nucleotidyltransferase with HDIG domain
MNLVDTILQSATELPPFPKVMQRALELIHDPRSSAQDVVDVIQFDPSLTARILKVCNSAFLGLRRKIHSLREALIMIGFQQLLEIILSQETMHLFYAPWRGYDLGAGELWRHSVASSLLSGIISKKLSHEVNPASFTAALLHDVGKTALSKFVKDYLVDIRNLVRHRRLSFIEAEKEVLGVDHAELGARMIEGWNFPKSIVAAVRYHHSPSLTPTDREMADLVYLCDVVAMMTGIGGGADGLLYHAYNEVMQQYGLAEKDVERFMIQLNDRFRLVNEVLDPREPAARDVGTPSTAAADAPV